MDLRPEKGKVAHLGEEVGRRDARCSEEGECAGPPSWALRVEMLGEVPQEGLNRIFISVQVSPFPVVASTDWWVPGHGVLRQPWCRLSGCSFSGPGAET